MEEKTHIVQQIKQSITALSKLIEDAENKGLTIKINTTDEKWLEKDSPKIALEIFEKITY